MKLADIAFVFTALFPLTTVGAQISGTDNCLRLQAAIESSEKELAWSQAAEDFETSAIRQTDADQKVANELQSIAINLSIANQLHCAPRREPVTKSEYFTAARACVRAALGRGAQGGAANRDDLPPECVRSNWIRDSIPAR